METQLLPVLNLCLRSIVNDEVWLLIELSLVLRTDEHICYEVCLPCYLNDETYLHTCILVCTAETIYYEQLLIRKLLLSDLLNGVPCLWSCLVVIVVILLRIPPYSVVRCSIVNDELVFRRTTSVNTSHYVNCTELSLLTNLKTLETFLSLLIEQYLIRRIVENLSCTCDSVLC